MTLNDPYPRFQGHAILWRWKSQKLYENTNRDLRTPYSTVSFRMTLSDLAKYSMTRSIARSLCDCDSWASCLLWHYCFVVFSVCRLIIPICLFIKVERQFAQTTTTNNQQKNATHKFVLSWYINYACSRLLFFLSTMHVSVFLTFRATLQIKFVTSYMALLLHVVCTIFKRLTLR